MHVGISTSLLEPTRNGGRLDGIGIYTRALQQGLAQLGVRVQGYSSPLFSIATQFVEGKRLPHSFPVQMMLASVGMNMSVSEPLDVFHNTDYQAVRMRCPVITTLHDAIPLKHPEWTGGRGRALKSLALRRSATYADHIIAVSQAAVPDIVEHFRVDERRITVVPCGVDACWFDKPSDVEIESVLTKHRLRPGYFLYVGTLQPRKNVARILDAYEMLPETVRRERGLVIVGRVGWHCDDEVRRLEAERAADSRVVWLENIRDTAALRCLYGGAGVFVFPSLYEGFGLPVLEAFASGLPVITSNTSSLPEVAAGAALLVDPMDSQAIAHAMQRLAQSESLCTRFVTMGYVRAKQLSWDNVARMTTDVYRRVAA